MIKKGLRLNKFLRFLNEKKPTYQVLCFGDSLTKGYYMGGHAYHPYSKVLEERFPSLNFIEKGQNGECVVNMRERLEKILKSKQFDYVILLGGLNDLGFGSSVDEIIEAFKDIYSYIESQSRVKKFYHVTIPYNQYDENKDMELTRDKKLKINTFILEELHSDKRIVVDIGDTKFCFNYLNLDDFHRKLYWDDPLHFTVEGYNMLGKCIGDVFQNNTIIEKQSPSRS